VTGASDSGRDVTGSVDSLELLHHVLERPAAVCPNREAVVQGKERKCYAEIETNANRVAHALIDAGVGKGGRVGLLMPNSARYVCGYFGILKAGAVAVPINTAISPDSLQYILEDAEIQVLIFDSRMKAVKPGIVRRDGSGPALFVDGEPSSFSSPLVGESLRVRTLDHIFEKEPARKPEARVCEEDLACLLYTSGSTGRPKGVMLSHSNIVENTKSIIEYLRLDQTDRMMVILPFFYCYGASLLHTHFAVGGSLVLENQFLYPNKVLEVMQKERATGFAGVPSSFAILLRRSDIRTRLFPHLRYVSQAGGGMAPALIRELRTALPTTEIVIMYGQTEASARLSYLPPALLDEKLGSVGKGIPGVELMVLNEEGKPVRPGETGEIVARGPNIMKGYWKSPEETALVLDAFGLHTGDLAQVDEDGFIYIVARQKDMIKSGAHRVSAKEIEEVLLEEPSVLECAVIGVQDEMMGEGIKALIVPVKRGQVEVEKILQFCKRRLPPYKVPRQIEIVGHLPKNEAGKIMKGLLQTGARKERKIG